MDEPEARWYREWELWLTIAVVAVLYFCRLDAITIRGEESRRARVAVEMIDSGNWIVPMQQGELYFSRPPLQNWAIGLAGLVRGEVDALAIRLPSVLATLLTTIIIYGYARSWLSRLGALTAAMAFASMVEVIKLGRLGETEAVFTATLGGALMVWHWGYAKGWRPVWTWSLAYLLAAWATLAKGPQAPVYFGGSILVFLALARDWRYLFSWSHFAGLGVFLIVWGAWHVPYQLAVGWDNVLAMYTTTTGQRFIDRRLSRLVEHLLVFPVELAGCLLPWSFLFLAYLRRDFREAIGAARPHVVFLMGCFAVAFPTCWFVAMANTRYLMPLSPCLACLAGLVADRCWHAGRDARWRVIWPWFVSIHALVAAGTAVTIVVASLVGPPSFPLGQPLWFAFPLATVMLATAAALFWARTASDAGRRLAGVLGVVVLIGGTYVTVGLNVQIRLSEFSAPRAVAAIKRSLPPGTRLVSVGRVDHLFAYYYRDLIPVADRSAATVENGPPNDYFCYDRRTVSPELIRFPHQIVATVNCERNFNDKVKRLMVIARRLPATAVHPGRLADVPKRR